MTKNYPLMFLLYHKDNSVMPKELYELLLSIDGILNSFNNDSCNYGFWKDFINTLEILDTSNISVDFAELEKFCKSCEYVYDKKLPAFVRESIIQLQIKRR